MSPQERVIGAKIKETVLSFDSEAQVYLYGSRARGEETPESDWDVLILSQNTVTPLIKRTIRHALYDIEWENGCVISSIIHETKEWESPRMKLTPLYRNIERDSISL
jgi:uncharacterized protein